MLGLLGSGPAGGVALRREWISDHAQIVCSGEKVDALLVNGSEPAELAGLLLAALRLDLPALVAAPERSLGGSRGGSAFSVALAAMGFAPLVGDPGEAVVATARSGGPRPRELIDNFSLANALRAGLAAGAGPELLVHLAAIAREAGSFGFEQMARVLAPESPELPDPASFPSETCGAAGLLARLGGILHDVRTVEGRLKEALPDLWEGQSPPAEGGARLIFVRGRASGTEILCRVGGEEAEISGTCRVYPSEEAAIKAVGDGVVDASNLVVVGGCGPRGGPGLLRLDRLGEVLREAGLAVSVLTDGLPPTGAPGSWASLATPEAAAGGVIGRLRDGDFLRLDLEEGLIRTGVGAGEILDREPLTVPAPSGYGYAARYASSALPALEGAGFG